MTLTASRMALSLNETKTALSSLTLDGVELLSPVQEPLFSCRLRGRDHTARVFSAADADVMTMEASDNGVALT